MRVALVHPYSWPEVRRGGERYLDDLAWWLASEGHEVDVITGTTGEASVDVEGGRTIRRVRHVHPAVLARRGVTPLDTFGAAVLVTLARGRYDVVHALTPTAAIASRLARCRTVYTVIGHPTPAQFGRRPLDRRVVATAVRVATEVTALSHASARQVEVMFGRRARVLAPGVRLDVFAPKVTPPAEPPRVLFNADASDARKGVHFALAAAKRLPGVRLVLGGPGDHTWALHGLAGDAGDVEVLGPGRLEDVPGRYRDAWVTVLPSLYEAFGLVLVESLASGTPVVGADAGGIPEVLTGAGDVGRVVRHGDVDGLAEALRRAIELARDPSTPHACATHAARYGWAERVGPAHVELYSRVSAGP